MKRIEDKKFLIDLLLKTNLVIDAMGIVFDIESMKFVHPNRVIFDDGSVAEFDLLIPISAERNDSGRDLSRKDTKHIQYVCKSVEEVRQFVTMHLYDFNAVKLENFTDADKGFVEEKIDYLNEVFNEYKNTILIETYHPYVTDINKYFTLFPKDDNNV